MFDYWLVGKINNKMETWCRWLGLLIEFHGTRPTATDWLIKCWRINRISGVHFFCKCRWERQWRTRAVRWIIQMTRIRVLLYYVIIKIAWGIIFINGFSFHFAASKEKYANTFISRSTHEAIILEGPKETLILKMN